MRVKSRVAALEAERQRVAEEMARAQSERQRAVAAAALEVERQKTAREAAAKLDEERVAAEAERQRLAEEAAAQAEREVDVLRDLWRPGWRTSDEAGEGYPEVPEAWLAAVAEAAAKSVANDSCCSADKVIEEMIRELQRLVNVAAS